MEKKKINRKIFYTRDKPGNIINFAFHARGAWQIQPLSPLFLAQENHLSNDSLGT
jgi:hypothetical protein